MAAVRFAFGNHPVISARAARAVAQLLKARRTPPSLKLADKFLGQADREDRLIADLGLKRPEMLELLTALNEQSAKRRLDSDSMYRFHAELEAAVNRI